MPKLKTPKGTIDIDETTTPAQALVTLFGADANKVRLMYGSKPLNPAVAIVALLPEPVDGVYNCSLALKPQELAPTQPVEEALTNFLLTMMAQPPKSTFLLISTGCYLNTNKGLEDAHAQQCPVDVIEYCKQNKLNLLALLVDPNFGANDAPHQLYHYPPEASGLTFVPGAASSTSLYGSWDCATEPIQIRTYGTATVMDSGITTIGGADLLGLGAAMEKAGSHVLVRVYNGTIQYRSANCPELGNR